jgi:hypothetical protein
LATLDVDSDGALRGEELKGIALWFDGDRDGVSQPGEVKQLHHVGVTAIFTRSEGRDSRGNPFAKRGYEVMRNGTPTIRPSVDWLTKGASNASSLIASAIYGGGGDARGSGGSVGAVNKHGLEVEKITANHDTTSTAKSVTWAPATKVWEWRLKHDGDAPDQSPLSGYLLFGLTEDGKLKGHSISVLPVKPGHVEKVALNRSELEGERLSDTKITFTLKGRPTEGQELRSEGTFLADGTLSGVTVVKMTGVTGTETISYEWVAKPLS